MSASTSASRSSTSSRSRSSSSASRSELAGDGASRQPARDGRHVDRARRDVLAQTPASAGGRSRSASSSAARSASIAALGQDDRDAADGRALQRRGGGAAALVAMGEFYVQRRQHRRHGRRRSPSRSCSRRSSAAISFAGSIIAFLKLQELMTGRPITYPGQQVVNALVLLGDRRLAGWFVDRSARCRSWAFFGTARRGAAARRAVRAADRRRRHAGRHLAAQLVHRPRRRDDRLRSRTTC